jgi:transposase
LAEQCELVGGADTHADTVHVAAITATGQLVGDREFPTTPAGYRAAIQFLTGLGAIRLVGIEGTCSYGAGLTRAMLGAGIRVLEVTRASKATRRLNGKSDPLDAYSAARTALAGEGVAIPKDDNTTAVRALLIARRSGMKTRTGAINQIKALIVGAPDEVREKYRRTANSALIDALARCRPDTQVDPIAAAVLAACKALAERVRFLQDQDQALTARLDALVGQFNPGLRAAYGVGPDTAAQLIVTAGTNPHRLHSEAAFAALCGAAPVPASSGKTSRHRLSRGGDRGANNALHRIALVRMSHHKQTRNYVQRQLANGRSKMEILRLLKRAIAREIFKLLTRTVDIPGYADLRPARQAKNITVTAAANQFGVWPTVISRIERGLQRDDQLADRYRTWLNAA